MSNVPISGLLRLWRHFMNSDVMQSCPITRPLSSDVTLKPHPLKALLTCFWRFDDQDMTLHTYLIHLFSLTSRWIGRHALLIGLKLFFSRIFFFISPASFIYLLHLLIWHFSFLLCFFYFSCCHPPSCLFSGYILLYIESIFFFLYLTHLGV